MIAREVGHYIALRVVQGGGVGEMKSNWEFVLLLFNPPFNFFFMPSPASVFFLLGESTLKELRLNSEKVIYYSLGLFLYENFSISLIVGGGVD